VEKPHAGAGEKCEAERVDERSCYGLTVTPYSSSSYPAQQEAEESGVRE